MIKLLRKEPGYEKIAKETFSENSLGSELPSVIIDKNQLDKSLNIIDNSCALFVLQVRQ